MNTNELLGSITSKDFLEQVNKYWLLKDSAPWR
jgi:hypothetical protein